MPRVIGIDIPNKKRLVIALTYIYGVGNTMAAQIIDQLGFNPDMRAEELSPDDIARLNALLSGGEYLVEGDLRRFNQGNIKRLMSINCYRGQRHRVGLPVRGQRTSTNARTRKGPRRAIRK